VVSLRGAVALAVAVVALVATVAACGAQGAAQPLVWACGTVAPQPIALPGEACDPNDGDRVLGDGVTVAHWYWAPADDIEDDDVAVPYQPLDGDWWNPADRADIDESDSHARSHRPTRRGPAASPSPTTSTTTVQDRRGTRRSAARTAAPQSR
jgi:hypothetical protein